MVISSKDKEKIEWPYKHFTKQEVMCKCGCGGLPQKKLLDTMESMREEEGVPYILTSVFRCAKHNSNVSDTGSEGPHTTGLAFDRKVSGAAALKAIAIALKYGATGIGVKQKGLINERFLHIDFIPTGSKIPRPAVWSY